MPGPFVPPPPPYQLRRVDVGAGVAIEVLSNNLLLVEHDCEALRSREPERASCRLAHHSIVQSEPLTLEPDILCLDCGLHGRVTEGEWWPALLGLAVD